MKNILLKSTFIVYLIIALEIFIMISPFAAYFYSFYGPLVNYLYMSKYTFWLTEFFLPHFVFIREPFMLILGAVQLITFFSGIALFMYAAIPLYYNKFRRKGVLTKGIYYRIRHPQYLGLGIAGFGLLLYWPRFLILILYISMLFVYYLLAKNEEQRMIRNYGMAYINYMNGVPMFLPKEIGGRIYKIFFGGIKSKALGILMLYVITVVISVFLAIKMRSIVIDKIPTFEVDGLSVVSVLPESEDVIAQVFKLIKGNETVETLIETQKPDIAYLMPSDFFLMALVTDLERLYPIEFERPAGGNTIVRFFKIFLNYTKMQLGIYTDAHRLKRIIFISVKRHDGTSADKDHFFSFGLRRFPLFHVDINLEAKDIISVRKLEPSHKWGKIPMPVF